jgi:hypothetical protein
MQKQLPLPMGLTIGEHPDRIGGHGMEAPTEPRAALPFYSRDWVAVRFSRASTKATAGPFETAGRSAQTGPSGPPNQEGERHGRS